MTSRNSISVPRKRARGVSGAGRRRKRGAKKHLALDSDLASQTRPASSPAGGAGPYQGGSKHGRSGSADGGRHDRKKFSARRGQARRQARDPREEVRDLAAHKLAAM